MVRICVGVHVHAKPEQLRASLASLRNNTGRPVELLLLPDGPDEPTKAALAALHELPQLGTKEPLGPPACFNRLAASTSAEVLVLLESGAIVGPGWLDHLLDALEADPQNGLAGPSTNRAWNEQGVFPHRRGTFADVARTAKEAARRFGRVWRTLAPLHSLSDFCYVVRREVIDAIGAADESYGLGPCWEMDYNIRAARAGFRSVWAQAAYVYRSPFTTRRRLEEARLFEASKHRYQDKFCALKLRNEGSGCRAHCRGDACEHFAPRNLIQIELPLPKSTSVATPIPEITPKSVSDTNFSLALPERVPLVSCIMPTGNRSAFVLQSVRYFQQQTYPNRELIIVDDGNDGLQAQLPDDSRITYLRLQPGLSIGKKRNRACEVAKGAFIAQWDDDDWYAATRLENQLAPLLSGEADITAFRDTVFFELDRWRFWTCSSALHRRLFVEDVHGGTLVYRRRVWEQYTRYPDRSLAEDAVFLRQAMRRGARLSKLPNDHQYIYLRHTQNSWSFSCGYYPDKRGWQQIPEPDLPEMDRAFYAAQSAAISNLSAGMVSLQPLGSQPLVSCIMPTADRRQFVSQSIRYFLAQDYENSELIIMDDGVDPVADLVPLDPRVRYLREERKQAVGTKRNLACQAAKGDIIVHWDDDDWMAPWRVRYQVASLLDREADVTGLDKVLYYDVNKGKAWQYVYPSSGRPWVAGNTLCYKLEVWRKSPFPEINVGEDTRFVWSHTPKTILPLQDCDFYVALIHSRNVSPKRVHGARWKPHPVERIRALMGADWSFYTELR